MDTKMNWRKEADPRYGSSRAIWISDFVYPDGSTKTVSIQYDDFEDDDGNGEAGYHFTIWDAPYLPFFIDADFHYQIEDVAAYFEDRYVTPFEGFKRSTGYGLPYLVSEDGNVHIFSYCWEDKKNKVRSANGFRSFWLAHKDYMDYIKLSPSEVEQLMEPENYRPRQEYKYKRVATK